MPYGGLTEESAGYWIPIGRLGEGVGMATAQDEMHQFLVRRFDVSPTDERLAGLQLLPLSTAIVSGESRQLVWWLLGAAGLVLLIATANVAGLQLAHAARRSEEMAIRGALGGGRRRLLGQLLVESLALAVLGGVLGVLVSVGVLRVLAAESLTPFTRFDIELSVLALGVAASVTLGAGLLAGIAPALRGSRIESGSRLREGDRAGTGSRGTSRFRSRLVVAQMAMAVTLLVGASLLLRTASALNRFDVGFDSGNLLTGETRLTAPMYQDEDIRRSYLQQVVQRLSAIPGVEGATLMKGMPFAGDADFIRVRNEGSDLDWDEARWVYSPPVAEGYFDFMGIRVLAGRPFERTDGPEAERVFVVSQSFADAFFDGASPVGRMIETADGPGRVVGVVQNSRRDFTTARDYEPVLYEHYLQDPPDFFSVLIRTQDAPESYQRRLLEAFWEVDPNQPLWEVMSIRQRMVDVTRNQRFFSVLLGGFAALALILSGVGLYGVMAHSVGSRRRELGVRIALGANRGRILQMVLGQAIVLTSIGVLLGIGGAALGARLLGSVLFGIEPFDLLSFTLAPAVLVAASIAAAYVPAWRATQVDPVETIRA
jgi:predicted permease